VTFTEAVDRATAENVNNYQLASGSVQSARLLADGGTVELVTAAALATGTNQLTVTGVQDLALPPNIILTGMSLSFVHRLAWMFDDFNDGDLAGWRIVDEGDIAGPSIWTVPFGKLDQSSEIFGPASGIASGRKGTLAVWSDPAALDWQDYTFRVTLRTPDPDGVGVAFRYSDPANYYKLELDQRAGFRKLLVISNGVERTLAQEAAGFALNTDLAVQVELSNAGVLCALNGQPLFGGFVSDRTLRAGTIALYCWQNAGATFDDVEVAPPPGFSMLSSPELRSGQFEFKLSSAAGAQFEVQTSSDLRTWDTFAVVTNSSGSIWLTAPAASAQGPRFYRARALP
jgi:hypothetical protein